MENNQEDERHEDYYSEHLYEQVNSYEIERNHRVIDLILDFEYDVEQAREEKKRRRRSLHLLPFILYFQSYQ